MKITDPQVIEDGEKDLIEAVQEDLDLDVVRKILKEQMGVPTLSSRGGQIVVHNNKIAFRLDFDIKLSGSLLFDREGNYIDTENDSRQGPEVDHSMDPEMELDEPDANDTLVDDKIEESLPLVETGLEETDLDKQVLDDELSIDLPEYDLEDEQDDDDDEIVSQPDDFGSQDLENDNPEDDGLEDVDLDNENLPQEEGLGNDIDGILKESREFWEQKKE